MLLRAAIVMLLMLNLGAAGWWLFQPPARATAIADATPSLRLLQERNAGRAPTASVPAPAAPALDMPPAPTAPAQVAPVPSPATGAPVCLRFGPFADGAARNAAGSALGRLGATALSPHDAPARGARGWKVFLPAQPSREAAQALAKQLEAAGVRDLFVMAQGEEANSIALGRFSTEAGARRRQAELQAKGVQARAEPVGGTPAQAWLDARLPATADPAALARIAPSRAVDCATPR